MSAPGGETSVTFAVADYDLAATLNSGQAFRWYPQGDAWAGVIGRHWVRLEQTEEGLAATASEPVQNWEWLAHYLQIRVSLDEVLKTFPQDVAMRQAVDACRGLRLLRQDPWECLASFILSSTKQIVQIRQIVNLLCERFGDPLPTVTLNSCPFSTQPNSFPAPERPQDGVQKGGSLAYTFPSAQRVAALNEADLRGCKMGFRAPYLLATAREIAHGNIALAKLESLSLADARAELLRLPGVGRKIADCVLLFAFGFQTAFPVDIWVLKALRSLYFPKRRPKPARLRAFADTYFGPYAGYAQQYLFHYMRTKEAQTRMKAGFNVIQERRTETKNKC